MKSRNLKILLLSATIALPAFASAAGDNSTRRERNYIVEGNKLYRNERYADAEVAYRKALEIDAMNEIAQFNLAAALLRQGTASGENEKQASQILGKLATDAENMSIAENAYYNLGNIAFNGQDYAKSIELYKNALRRNPDNDKARENLRLAQKRLEDQQNQDQNQNQDQDKDQQNQDQNKDQKKDQNKDQNKNQNKDQNQDQNKDQNKDQQQPQQQQPQDQKQQPQQQRQSGISKENAEKILKAMENEENATRQRVNAERNKSGAPARRQVTNPW